MCDEIIEETKTDLTISNKKKRPVKHNPSICTCIFIN